MAGSCIQLLLLSQGTEQADKALTLLVELLSLFISLFCLVLCCGDRSWSKGKGMLALLLTGRIGLLVSPLGEASPSV